MSRKRRRPMIERFTLFGDLQKIEEQDDGTLIVSGIASSEAVDADGEIITADAVRKALPDYMKFGNIREMHSNIAAGTALSCEVDADDVTHIEAHVVDPTSIKKVRAGVLKGFSLGGKKLSYDETNRRIITGICLSEISLVDRPSNPDSIISLVKFEEGDTPMEDNSLAKYVGEEIQDAATAVQCLCSIHYLLQKEMAEANEPPDQIEALQAVVEALKRFIASEIQEDNQDMTLKTDTGGTSATVGKSETSTEMEAELMTAENALAKAAKARLEEVHKAMAEAMDAHKAAVGAHQEAYSKLSAAHKMYKAYHKGIIDSKPEGEEEAEEEEGEKEGEGETKEECSKAEGADTLQKVASLEKSIQTLQDQITKMSKTPVMTPGEVRALSKDDDGAALQKTTTPSTPEEAMRKAHSAPFLTQRFGVL